MLLNKQNTLSGIDVNQETYSYEFRFKVKTKELMDNQNKIYTVRFYGTLYKLYPYIFQEILV